MSLSVVGLLVCVVIALAARAFGGGLVAGLMISLAFGSTALLLFGSLGGSSPLVFTVFAAALVLAVAGRRKIWRELGALFASAPVMWLLLFLMAYAVAGAVLFPRLFAGKVIVFVRQTGGNGIVESGLAPVSGNITQAGYFLLGGSVALAIAVLVFHADRVDQVRRAFLAWCAVHTGMGVLDLAGKLAGFGDVLLPIRTANYALLTDISEASFARIVGGYPEASGFAGMSLAAVAFLFADWRRTGSRFALVLMLTLLALLLMSTSSTAYVGLAILGVPILMSATGALLSGRGARSDVAVLASVMVMGAVLLSSVIADSRYLASFLNLLDATVVNKSQSISGQERLYWNIKSFEAFVDTSFLGIGIGSSRASSWPVAVLSQLGLVGAIFMALLTAAIVGSGGRRSPPLDRDAAALTSSIRAAVVAALVSASLTGGSADPGMLFFVSLGIVVALRARASVRAPSPIGRREAAVAAGA
ncbi:hypothetical protein [Chthonobacter rhizosphaerae]|uniref:hypothetical protein n=1 Tax=Chthonobacter rhizosphaerae TaxID=2735553 RepID=UPI0015EF2D4B|nr:hypothetical protein [Chthonobacter rhizosphaerae]